MKAGLLATAVFTIGLVSVLDCDAQVGPPPTTPPAPAPPLGSTPGGAPVPGTGGTQPTCQQRFTPLGVSTYGSGGSVVWYIDAVGGKIVKCWSDSHIALGCQAKGLP
jgi:hypothetical protein